MFFLIVDPKEKEHQDPEHIDFSVPRQARYLHSAWKKHQDSVFWVDIYLAIEKGLTFYQTRSIAVIPQGTNTSSVLIPKGERLKIGEFLYEALYMSPRPSPKISFRHDLNWTEGMINWVDRRFVFCFKVKLPVHTRSLKKVCTKNLFFQIDRGNQIICLKTPVLSKLTMEQGNLSIEIAQVHTQ